MKSAKFLNLIVLGLVLTIPLVGCKRNPRGITPLPGAKVSTPATPGGGGMITGPGGGGPVGIDVPSPGGGTPLPAPGSYEGWPEDSEFFKSQTVLFDFDSAVVKGSEKSKADSVAAHLSSNPSHAVNVEGHCDERGTEEYNRSLGERRALAVREQLIAAGISSDRVVTITYGEDRPVDPGHSEAAWKKNRRGEFILLTPPK
jgi:peptidoglycan-associated lipoprotein